MANKHLPNVSLILIGYFHPLALYCFLFLHNGIMGGNSPESSYDQDNHQADGDNCYQCFVSFIHEFP